MLFILQPEKDRFFAPLLGRVYFGLTVSALFLRNGQSR
jgi:hypothetical protein